MYIFGKVLWWAGAILGMIAIGFPAVLIFSALLIPSAGSPEVTELFLKVAVGAAILALALFLIGEDLIKKRGPSKRRSSK